MESMNKFRALTIMIICLFVFAIAAMYVNTKDVSEQKSQEYSQNGDSDYGASNTRAGREQMDMTDIMYALNNLETKVNDLETKVEKNARSTSRSSESGSSASGMRCRIIGSKTASGIEDLSPEVAIQDAKINGNEIVVTCSLR